MTGRGAYALPDDRPKGLRTRQIDAAWWRVDAVHPRDWSWTGFDEPRHRFDPISGRFRVRYAASTQRAAARERFPERRLAAADGDLWLVRLAGPVRVFDLCAERTQDRLGVDDRINTARMPHVRAPGRADPFLDACGHLTDLVADWWAGGVPTIRYRSRTTPVTGRNLAFCRAAMWHTVRATRLADAGPLLVSLVEGDGFRAPREWLARLA